MIHPGVGNPQVQEIAPGVFFINRLVHFFADIGVNAGIIQTPEEIIFIDTGMSSYSGEYLWSIAEEYMNGTEKLFLIITHKDQDHWFGMDSMKARGAHVIMHSHAADVLDTFKDLSMNPIALRVRKEYQDDVLGDVILSEPDQIITDDTILNLSEEIQILSVPGHTPSDIAVYHPKSKVLFTGDAVLEGMDPYIRPDSIDIDTWISNLERLKKLDIKWVCPGHGALSKPDIIESNIRYLRKH